MTKNSYKKYTLDKPKTSKKKMQQIVTEMRRARNDKHLFELYIYTWSLIEEVFLPEFISLILKNLKIDSPSSLERLNQFSINHFYFAISGGDKELFEMLEKARSTRNKYIHKLIGSNNLPVDDKKVQRDLSSLAKILEAFKMREEGKTKIPSIDRYYQGWNDAIKECLRVVENKNNA